MGPSFAGRISLDVCLISKGEDTISPNGLRIVTMLLPFETSIPTAFINLSLLKNITMDKYQIYSLPAQTTVCDTNALNVIQPA